MLSMPCPYPLGPLQRLPVTLVDSSWKNKNKRLTSTPGPLSVRAFSDPGVCLTCVQCRQECLTVNAPGATPNTEGMQVRENYPSCFPALSRKIHSWLLSCDILPNKLLQPKSIFQSLLWRKPKLGTRFSQQPNEDGGNYPCHCVIYAETDACGS